MYFRKEAHASWIDGVYIGCLLSGFRVDDVLFVGVQYGFTLSLRVQLCRCLCLCFCALGFVL